MDVDVILTGGVAIQRQPHESYARSTHNGTPSYNLVLSSISPEEPASDRHFCKSRVSKHAQAKAREASYSLEHAHMEGTLQLHVGKDAPPVPMVQWSVPAVAEHMVAGAVGNGNARALRVYAHWNYSTNRLQLVTVGAPGYMQPTSEHTASLTFQPAWGARWDAMDESIHIRTSGRRGITFANTPFEWDVAKLSDKFCLSCTLPDGKYYLSHIEMPGNQPKHLFCLSPYESDRSELSFEVSRRGPVWDWNDLDVLYFPYNVHTDCIHFVRAVDAFDTSRAETARFHEEQRYTLFVESTPEMVDLYHGGASCLSIGDSSWCQIGSHYRNGDGNIIGNDNTTLTGETHCGENGALNITMIDSDVENRNEFTVLISLVRGPNIAIDASGALRILDADPSNNVRIRIHDDNTFTFPDATGTGSNGFAGSKVRYRLLDCDQRPVTIKHLRDYRPRIRSPEITHIGSTWTCAGRDMFSLQETLETYRVVNINTVDAVETFEMGPETEAAVDTAVFATNIHARPVAIVRDGKVLQYKFVPPTFGAQSDDISDTVFDSNAGTEISMYLGDKQFLSLTDAGIRIETAGKDSTVSCRVLFIKTNEYSFYTVQNGTVYAMKFYDESNPQKIDCEAIENTGGKLVDEVFTDKYRFKIEPHGEGTVVLKTHTAHYVAIAGGGVDLVPVGTPQAAVAVTIGGVTPKDLHHMLFEDFNSESVTKQQVKAAKVHIDFDLLKDVQDSYVRGSIAYISPSLQRVGFSYNRSTEKWQYEPCSLAAKTSIQPMNAVVPIFFGKHVWIELLNDESNVQYLCNKVVRVGEVHTDNPDCNNFDLSKSNGESLVGVGETTDTVFVVSPVDDAAHEIQNAYSCTIKRHVDQPGYPPTYLTMGHTNKRIMFTPEATTMYLRWSSGENGTHVYELWFYYDAKTYRLCKVDDGVVFKEENGQGTGTDAEAADLVFKVVNAEAVVYDVMIGGAEHDLHVLDEPHQEYIASTVDFENFETSIEGMVDPTQDLGDTEYARFAESGVVKAVQKNTKLSKAGDILQQYIAKINPTQLPKTSCNDRKTGCSEIKLPDNTIRGLLYGNTDNIPLIVSGSEIFRGTWKIKQNHEFPNKAFEIYRHVNDGMSPPEEAKAREYLFVHDVKNRCLNIGCDAVAFVSSAAQGESAPPAFLTNLKDNNGSPLSVSADGASKKTTFLWAVVTKSEFLTKDSRLTPETHVAYDIRVITFDQDIPKIGEDYLARDQVNPDLVKQIAAKRAAGKKLAGRINRAILLWMLIALTWLLFVSPFVNSLVVALCVTFVAVVVYVSSTRVVEEMVYKNKVDVRVGNWVAASPFGFLGVVGSYKFFTMLHKRLQAWAGTKRGAGGTNPAGP